MTRYTLSILLGASLGVTACSGNIDGGNTGNNNTGDDDNSDPGNTTGGDGTTFDHPNDGPSPFDIIDRIHQEGPSSFSSQMASCSKIPYAVLGNLLTSIGVDKTLTANKTSAISLYNAGGDAMGQPQYASRIRENSQVTTSGASKLFDIFAAAAPEVIKNIATLTRCQVNGVAPVLFDASNVCHIEGISCLLGMPATQGHVELCNQAVKAGSATTVDNGKNIAVAALLAAAYTCD